MSALQSQVLPPRLPRTAGFYLAVIACGVLGEALLRAPLIDASDAEAAAGNLVAAASSFRVSILLDVVMALCDVALAVLLYPLLEPVSRALSLAATAFRLVQAHPRHQLGQPPPSRVARFGGR